MGKGARLPQNTRIFGKNGASSDMAVLSNHAIRWAPRVRGERGFALGVDVNLRVYAH
jgi:hypothetical protein